MNIADLLLILLLSGQLTQGHSLLNLIEVENYSFCPSRVAMFTCSLPNDKLEWICSDGTSRLILCSTTNALPKTCGNTTIQVHLDGCENTPSRTEIKSSVMFNTSVGTTTLVCRDASDPSVNDTLSITIEAPSPPLLHTSEQIQQATNDKQKVITFQWQKLPNTEELSSYAVSVFPATAECNTTCVTNQTHMQLTLQIDTLYNVSVRTETCGGDLKSGFSQPISIMLEVPPAVSWCYATFNHGENGPYLQSVQWNLLPMQDRHYEMNITKLLYYNLTFSVMGNVHSQKIHPKHCNTVCLYENTDHINITAVSISGVNAIGHGKRTSCIEVSSMDKDTTTCSPSNENTQNAPVTAVAASIALLLLLLIIIITIMALIVLLCKYTKVHISKPRGIALSKCGDIYVCDYKNCSVEVFDCEGKWLRRLRMNYQLRSPRGIDIDKMDNIYICDLGNDAVVKLPLTDSSIHAPKPTIYHGDQQPLRYPYSLTVVDEIGCVFISYNSNREIIATDLQLKTREHAAGGPDALPYPIGVAYYDDHLYVVDNRRENQVAVFKRGKKRPVHEFNSTRDRAGNEYSFAFARAIHVANELIYVVDATENRVMVMDMQYRLLAKFGEEELMHPTAITVSNENVYVTSDPKDNRGAAVVVYELKLDEMSVVLKQIVT